MNDYKLHYLNVIAAGGPSTLDTFTGPDPTNTAAVCPNGLEAAVSRLPDRVGTGCASRQFTIYSH